MRKLCIAILAVATLVACQTPKVVTVEKPVYIYDTILSNHEGYEHEKDSVIIEKTTTVQVADSAVMARLAEMGLLLDNRNQYILVMQHELERRISELASSQSDSSYVSTMTPVEIKTTEYVEVEKKLSFVQKMMIRLGWILSVIIVLFIIYKVWLKKFK